MTPDFERRRDEILEGALGLPPQARPQFLDQECAGDIPLRREIERLLQVNRQMAPNFLADAAVHWLNPQFERGQNIGRYIIDELIGAGGMSRVYRALDPYISRSVALKVLLPAGAEGNQHFFAELRTLGSIKHDAVVRVYDCGEFKGIPYIVMEYLEGEDLARSLKAGRCGDFASKLDIARQIATALIHVHSAGIIHRDLKPANIFVEPSGRIKVMDFGIARSMASALTQTKILIGTPEYMSPEQVKGQPATPLSDISSFGVILYELFTGVRPFSGNTADILYKIVHESLPLEPLRKSELPSELIGLIRRTTAKDPNKRPQTFTVVLDQLENMSHEGQHPRSKMWLTHLPVRRTIAMATIMSALIIVPYLYVANHKSEQSNVPLKEAAESISDRAAPNFSEATRHQENTTAPEPVPPARTPIRKNPEVARSRSPSASSVNAPNEVKSTSPAEPASVPVVSAQPSAITDSPIALLSQREANRENVSASAANAASPPEPQPPKVSASSASANQPAGAVEANRTADQAVIDRTKDRQEIFSVLQQYSGAYQKKDLPGLVAIRPTLTQVELRIMENSFERARTVEHDYIVEAGPDFIPATAIRPLSAVVRCVRRVRMIPYAGRAPAPQEDRISVKLEWRNGSWKIISSE